jgi:hypothetical protein
VDRVLLANLDSPWRKVCDPSVLGAGTDAIERPCGRWCHGSGTDTVIRSVQIP